MSSCSPTRSSISQGSQLSIPSNSAPSARRSHCSRPHGSVATRRRARARTSSVGISSRAGTMATSASSAVDRWSLTPKRVSRSTSSPHRSMRTGPSAVAGNTSTMAPRRANSPRCSTRSSRRYPKWTRRAPSSSGSTTSPRRMQMGSTVGGAGAEALQEGTDAGDDDRRATIGILEPPQQLEATTHRLDRRADPLEGQRLPGREQGHLVGGEELLEVLGQLGGHRARRRGDDERTAVGQRGEGGDRDRPGDLDDGQAGRRARRGRG